ncbi:MAG: hypothetical protein LBI04_07140 [Treponema sp.]|jgi:HEAT repeat protein|nr:hypothetical protein [Treponema sp.]
MVKKASLFALLVCLCLPAFCDSPVLQLYKQRFSMADLSAKAQILENAANDITFNEDIGQFYEYTLQFALDNSMLLKNDHTMLRIIDISVKGMALSGLGKANYSNSLDILWKLFMEYPDSSIGAEILIAIGKLGKNNQNIIEGVNNYLTEKNVLYRSGSSVNYVMISACIIATMELNDSSFYPALFAVLCLGYPEMIKLEAHGALDIISGNLKQFLSDMIEKGDPAEKYFALMSGINSNKLTVSERGQLAEIALEQSLINGENADLSAMRYATVRALTQLRWTRANNLAIRHFYRVQTEFQNRAVARERFLEAIALLGAVGNSDAALALCLQLGLINARTERTGNFDEEITLAIVRALGLIGDKAAFDHLLNVSNLLYPENILAAAGEAIDRLRW